VSSEGLEVSDLDGALGKVFLGHLLQVGGRDVRLHNDDVRALDDLSGGLVKGDNGLGEPEDHHDCEDCHLHHLFSSFFFFGSKCERREKGQQKGVRVFMGEGPRGCGKRYLPLMGKIG